jgi:hypothetical protein
MLCKILKADQVGALQLTPGTVVDVPDSAVPYLERIHAVVPCTLADRQVNLDFENVVRNLQPGARLIVKNPEVS